MDQESIVYGCIKDAAHYQAQNERQRFNRSALLALPGADQWPLLSRDMFALPQVDGVDGNYQTEVLHFGASYKAIEYEWEQWLETFESLLKSMYWVSAVVHLETELNGIHTFTWESLSDSHSPGSEEMQLHCEWSHEGALGL